VEEIHARQRCRNGAVFLVDVVALARHVGIMTDDHERVRAGWRIAPRQMRVEIAAEADMVFRVSETERKVARDRLSVFETVAGHFHR
jgi:hypothetical protein